MEAEPPPGGGGGRKITCLLILGKNQYWYTRPLFRESEKMIIFDRAESAKALQVISSSSQVLLIGSEANGVGMVQMWSYLER